MSSKNQLDSSGNSGFKHSNDPV